MQMKTKIVSCPTVLISCLLYWK